MSIEDFEFTEVTPDYHAVVTIQLWELEEAGFCDETFTGWEWPKYSDEQDARLRAKLYDHYCTREIAIIPPGIWKREFIRKMREIMPKYVLIYKLLDENPELFGGNSEWYKGRDMYSDFPQTQLSGDNGDYASTGNDREYERIYMDNFLDTIQKLKNYDDIDLMIIKDMESMFSCLYTVNTNSY